MDADYKLLYDYYLERQKQYRQETADLLDKGETSTFGHGTNYLIRTNIEIEIEDELTVDQVIEKLQDIKSKLNHIHSTPILSSYATTDGETEMYISYYEYSIKSEKSCEGTAKHIVDSAVWKMKYQSKGKDAIAYQKRLDTLKNLQ